MKTFEDWWEGTESPDAVDSRNFAYARSGWQACAAEYQPIIDEARKLAGEIKKRAKVAYDQDLAARIIDALGNK